MKQISEKSIKNVNQVLEECDIYHVNGYPVKQLKKELPKRSTDITKGLVWAWLFENQGLLTTATQYNSDFKRGLSCLMQGDSPNSLRQRLNIVQILLETQGGSSVPVHITMFPDSPNQTVDLFEDNLSSWSHITHPGYTRAVGSIYLNLPLKNVLLYIKKDQNIQIKNDKRITKITSIEQLLERYAGTNTGKVTEFCFYMPRRHGQDPSYTNIVTHNHRGRGEVPILKANNIYIPETQTAYGKEPKCHIHPSRKYFANTISNFYNFTREIIRNTYTVYTEDVERTAVKFGTNLTHLFEDKFNVKLKGILKHSVLAEDHHQPSGHYGTTFHKYGIDIGQPQTDILENISKYLKNNVEIVDTDEDVVFVPEYKVRKIVKFDPGLIAEQNEFKGFALYVNENIVDSIERDVFEFLYCMNAEKAIMKTEDNSIAIINCGHTYWQTGKNYSEGILNKSFIKYG